MSELLGHYDHAELDTFVCPKCGDECWREDAHNGVCIIYGPWGCPACGWSEDPRYDVSEGDKYDRGYRLDQYGGLTPVGQEGKSDE